MMILEAITYGAMALLIGAILGWFINTILHLASRLIDEWLGL
jgi:hypothetical protein